MARRVAAGLADHPEWVALARANLDRWCAVNAGSPSLLRAYREWRTLLDGPVHDIVRVLTAEGDQGQRLRQNSPFVGVLPPETVWAIKDTARREQAAA